MLRHLLQSCPLCDRRSSASDIIVPTFASLSQLHNHLRLEHAHALGLAPPAPTSETTITSTRRQSLLQSSRSRRLAARSALLNHLRIDPAVLSPRSLTTAVNALVPTLRPSSRFRPTCAASSDGVAILCSSAYLKRGNNTTVILVDYANLPSWAVLLERVDPGAERFLTTTNATIIVVAEPRAPLFELFQSRFARNVRKAGRLSIHRCRRCREAGDLQMTDLAVRLSVSAAAAAAISATSNDSNTVPSSSLRLHVLGNDLRHRRSLQSILRLSSPTAVEVFGHHAFSGTECDWLAAMELMLDSMAEERDGRAK